MGLRYSKRIAYSVLTFMTIALSCSLVYVAKRFPTADSTSSGGLALVEQISLSNRPKVVTVDATGRRVVLVAGEVRKPGSWELEAQQKITVAQMIALAGGMTSFADPMKIEVRTPGVGGFILGSGDMLLPRSNSMTVIRVAARKGVTSSRGNELNTPTNVQPPAMKSDWR